MKQQQELIPMEMGEYLKQQRLERKLSLEAVARAIGLDAKMLGAIELDQAGHIASVYRNGYIRSYARYLKIPEEEIQNLLLCKDSEEPVIRNIFSEPPKRNPVDKWLRATSYVLASLLIGTLAWQFTHEAIRLSQNGSQLHDVEESTQRPGITTKQDQSQEFRGPVNASIAPLVALHSNEIAGEDTAAQAWAALARPVLVDDESHLQINVSADSWIEITDADGQELEMDLLRGGSDKAYRGKAPFRILLGRASAVRLSMDGEPVDLTVYTRDGVAQFTWPARVHNENKGPGDH